MRKLATISVVVVAIATAPAAAQIDGVALGGTLRATQNSPTSFGDAVGGGQDSAGGGELDAMYGDIVGSTLSLAISGNIEANFNKAWIFFDTKAGGETTLDNLNTDGGFNEIQAMAGMTFDPGFAPDYAIRIEIDPGFYGINFADLVPNTSGNIWNGGGSNALPEGPNAGGFGVTFGWDNSNILGVTSSDASGALTATTGWEFSIDMATAFGDGSLTSLKVMALYGNGGADFMSNQSLPGVGFGGGDQLGGPGGINFGNIAGDQFAVIPEPGSIGMLALGGLILIRRRR